MLINHKKGQVAVLDLFISALIFGIIITTVMFTWNNYNIKIDKQIDYNTDLLRAYQISDLLVKFPGKPSAWEFYDILGNQTIAVVGLAKDDRVIDENKLNSFLSMDYDFTRNKLGINSYDYYFKITYLNGSDFNPIIEKGYKTNRSISVTLKRYVIYNGEETIVEFWLQR